MSVFYSTLSGWGFTATPGIHFGMLGGKLHSKAPLLGVAAAQSPSPRKHAKR